MANISYDGHGIILDGRRIWLVSGAMDYARIPRELWRDRIRAAKQAGLNCIQTGVFWNVHEPQPGVFRFDGSADLEYFIEILAEEEMYCILRPGPFVGGGWDMGGLPPWLLEVEPMLDAKKNPVPMRLRQASPPFLQAVARYLDAVMNQIVRLQATDPRGGPIVLVQSEHEWLCHNEQQAEGYLHQVNRFLRESGCAVPLVNTNNLYQQVTGTIDGWDGDSNLLANCRQLRVLQPDAPCLVMSLPTGGADTWGGARQDPRPSEHVMRSMAEVSAAGGMFNLDPFCGGTNFGFYGGRFLGGDHRFAAASHDAHAPLSETGRRTEKYGRMKRLCIFLSQFGPLMASLNSEERHTVAATGLSVVQQSGPSGRVVFLLRDDEQMERSGSRHVELTTPDGQTLPVDLGDDPAAWVALGVNLGGTATLDLTNLRPWAFLDRRLLVLFGPVGSEGIVSIDGTLLLPTVPTGDEPLVLKYEDDLHIVILNERQADAACIHDGGLYVGVGGIDGEDEPMPHEGFASYTAVRTNGKTKKYRHMAPDRPSAPALGPWRYADVKPYVSGTAPRYATLEGPRALEACGADFGYGWYRLRIQRPRAKKVNLLIPQAADRLHLYAEGKFQHVLGVGPGVSGDPGEGDTSGPVPFQLAAGETELVFLADNLGRFCEGLNLDQPKGLAGHLLDVKPVRLAQPDESSEPRVNPFELTGYVPHCTEDDRGPYPRFTFNVTLPSKQPLVLVLRGGRPRSVILVNNKPIAIDVDQNVTASLPLDDHLKKGRNKITLALIDHPEEPGGFDPRAVTTIYRVVENLSENGDWWYARWQMPDTPAFQDPPKSIPAAPAFFRTTFRVDHADHPLMLELDGPSKGQIYLNGHNLGRYFAATHTGAEVPPQNRHYLPEPWLDTEGQNELILFDEHGKPPGKSRLIYEDRSA